MRKDLASKVKWTFIIILLLSLSLNGILSCMYNHMSGRLSTADKMLMEASTNRTFYMEMGNMTKSYTIRIVRR